MLTDAQLEAMTAAVENGYYDIPRDISTAELGDQLGISDQAVTERLRRGISTLAANTMLAKSNS
ncbi:MAG: putative DNA binding protein [halophilic archaeon J07HX5]|jgi:Predicted DNA binding protein|nr:MAG: putative DNA binding protein [halophilic archaeon J07HX5]